MINRAIILGRVGSIRSIKTNSGNDFCTMSVATEHRYYDPKSCEKKKETVWHKVNLFGHLCFKVENYAHVGDFVYVEGSFMRRVHEKDGVNKIDCHIVGREIKIIYPQKNAGSKNIIQDNEAYLEHERHFLE